MATRPFERERRSQFLNDDFQQQLARWNRERLEPQFPQADWQQTIDRDATMLRLEGGFLEELRQDVIDEAAQAPTDPDGFIAWFEDLERTGPGQGDPLFAWLAERATRDDLRWFLQQEAAGEAGFDDLVAMTQVKLPTKPKMELARNYWDEMGRGQEKGMHGPMLDGLVDTLGLDPQIETTVWESLSLANAMTGMANARARSARSRRARLRCATRSGGSWPWQSSRWRAPGSPTRSSRSVGRDRAFRPSCRASGRASPSRCHGPSRPNSYARVRAWDGSGA